MSTEVKCGCKGIRTCLLCEQHDGLADPHKSEEVRYVYTYCPQCNLCWPDDEVTASLHDFPLYLGKLKLIPEFFSEEEEALSVSSIDRIPWMPSQSGRRKQDFGPKVNFKKKKVRIGEFRGFPKFTESILKRFKDLPELSDFQPVELCHLEYSPERGSSIDPHVDDFWLWGERLVTINLSSSTVLTLVPCSKDTCECPQAASQHSFQSYALFNEHHNEKKSCNHMFRDRSSLENYLKSLSVNDATASENGNTYSEELVDDIKNSEISIVTVEDECFSASATFRANKDDSEEIQYLEDQLSLKSCKISDGDINDSSLNCSQISDSHKNENEGIEMNHHSYQHNSENVIPSETNSRYFSSNCLSKPTKIADNRINTMCSVSRTTTSDSKVYVRIVLPPRSLLVLAGCARYNWFHEIKRQDVVSRRLAMTFRELTAEFLDEGKESQFGKDLLMIANNFYDL